MPIFSLISGFLYIYIRKKGGYDSFWLFISKKLKRLLVPLLIFGLFECTFDLGGDYSSLLLGPLHLWYLNFLLKCFVVTYIIDRWLIKRPWIIAPLIMALKIGQGVMPQFFSDDNFYRLYPYFLLGIGLQEMTCRGLIKNGSSQRLWIHTIMLLSIVLFCVAFIYNKGVGLGAMLFVVSLFLCLYICPITGVPSWLSNIDKCSMGIYLFHHPIMWNFVDTNCGRTLLIEHNFLTPFILIVGTFGFSWILTYLISKVKYLKIIIG
jgi:hypothetical protein